MLSNVLMQKSGCWIFLSNSLFLSLSLSLSFFLFLFFFFCFFCFFFCFCFFCWLTTNTNDNSWNACGCSVSQKQNIRVRMLVCVYLLGKTLQLIKGQSTKKSYQISKLRDWHRFRFECLSYKTGKIDVGVHSLLCCCASTLSWSDLRRGLAISFPICGQPMF